MSDNNPVSTNIIAPPKVYFICGGRRTGTTLLSAILCSDKRANPLGQECQLLTRMLEAYQWGVEKFDDFGRSFFESSSDYKTFYKKVVTDFTHTVAEKMSPGGVLILKNPELSKVIMAVDSLFPDATLLATVRDPRDQVAAELEVGKKRVGMGMKPPGYTQRNIGLLSERYSGFLRGILAIQENNPERICIVRYEDMVLDTLSVIKRLRIATNLDIDFDPNKPWPKVSRYAGLKSISPTSSKLYGGAVENSSVGRYKNDLNQEEISTIEDNCQRIMTLFNYK